MKNIGFFLLTLLFIQNSLAATVVGPMSFQGRLLDDQGIPVTATYDFKVALYDDPSAGSVQYAEDHDGVSVDDGVYSLKVGEGTNISGAYGWDTDLWQLNLNNLFMEIQVSDDGGQNYETLTPRHEVTSAPHAFTATLALSLGDRDISEFDNILEGICVSSNGRWMVSTDTCAGGDVDLTGLLPADFDNNGDFNELEFNDAIFTNASFYDGLTLPGGSQFMETQFIDTTFSNTDFTNADMRNATIDGGSIGTGVNFSGAILDNMVIKNIDATNLDISSAASYIGFAAGDLTACPSDPYSQLPPGWTCISYLNDAGATRYAFVGPGVDFSSGSPALTVRYGGEFLSVVSFTGQDLSQATFDNIILSSDFDGTFLQEASFQNAELINADFKNGTALSKTNFTNSVLNWVDFTNVDLAGGSGEPTLFTNAELANTTFSNTYHNDFTIWQQARLDTVSFTNVTGAGGTGNAVFVFEDGNLNDVSFQNSSVNLDFINTPLKDVTFSNITFGGTGVSFNSDGQGGVGGAQIVLEDLLFQDNILFGGSYNFDNVILKNVTFVNEDLTGAYFGPSTQLINVKFNNVNLANNPSFSNAVLDGITDWSGSTLTGINFAGQDLTGVDFSGITAINVNFDGAFLDDVNFAGATLTQSSFGSGPGENSMLGINWRGATLNDVSMNGDFKGTNFSSLTSATGSYWYGCYLRDTDFTGVDLSMATFSSAILENASFSSADLTDVWFDYAQLQYADLSGATMMNTNFSYADLSYADLNNSDLYSISSLNGAFLFQTILDGAVFSTSGNEIGYGIIDNTQFRRVEATAADFSGGWPGFVTYNNLLFEESTLSNADFTNANLQNSYFYETDLDGASFAYSQLNSVDFNNSDLAGADFTGAMFSPSVRFDRSDLSGADFTNADLNNVDPQTLCPSSNQSGYTEQGTVSLTGAIWTNATCPDGAFMNGSPGFQNCETDNHIPGCGI